MNDINQMKPTEKKPDREHAHIIPVGRPRLDGTEKADAIMHFKVTPSWRDMIKADAASQNMHVSEYLRDLTARRHRELQAEKP